MKAAILYFTGTGNTKFVSEVFKEHLLTLDYKVDMVDITKGPKTLKGYDLIILGTPTQNAISTSNMHRFFKRHVLRTDNPSARVMTFITHSWGTAYGHITLKDLAKKQGFDVVSARAFFAPSNFYMFNKDEPKFSEKRKLDTIQAIQMLVKEMVQDLVNQKVRYDERKKSTILKWQVRAGLMEAVGLHSKLAKFMFKVDQDKCSRCKVCIKKCPNDNIDLFESGITFKNQCLGCARCIHVCPKDAYSVQNKTFERYEGIEGKIIV